MNHNLFYIIVLISYVGIIESYTYESNIYCFVNNTLTGCNLKGRPIRRRALIPSVKSLIRADASSQPTELDSGSGTGIMAPRINPDATSQSYNVFDCCDVPRKFNSLCDCTMTHFYEENNTCVMSYPDEYCDFRNYMPYIPKVGRIIDLLHEQMNVMEHLDTYCMINGSSLYCLEELTEPDGVKLLYVFQLHQTTTQMKGTTQTKITPNCCSHHTLASKRGNNIIVSVFPVVMACLLCFWIVILFLENAKQTAEYNKSDQDC